MYLNTTIKTPVPIRVKDVDTTITQDLECGLLRYLLLVVINKQRHIYADFGI